MSAPTRDVAIRCRMLGSHSGAAILSVAGCFFHRKDGVSVGPIFYEEVGLSSALAASTLAQDMQLPWQGSDDLKRLVADNAKKKPLHVVLDHFASWMRATSGDVPVVWAIHHDDLAALETAYRLGTVGMSHPWYSTNTCTLQTLRHIAARCVPSYHSKAVPPPGKLTALDDARWLAALVSEMTVALTPAKPTPTPRPTPAPTLPPGTTDFEESEL